MPPLRERREDIPMPGGALRREIRARTRPVELSADALQALTAHDWPGNVRELENAIERAVVLGSSDRITAEDLPEMLVERRGGRGHRAPARRSTTASREVKRRLILDAIDRSGGNYTAAARLLGLNPTYLHRLLKNLQLKDVAARGASTPTAPQAVMTLSPGAKLGPYEITAPVGQGGMGEVYRARDTRIDRTVALKILAGTLSSIDHRASLEREARFVASLNHPHICALHDVSREKETPFLVMEYVQGETLAARLARGALPPREAIRYSIQIGEALDHAHRHGVVHRDLKPANIMLTKTGVKVLDFGLAALRTAAPIEVPLDRTPVAGERLTSEQALLGTVQYMAPERLEGRDADVASDLFAFGAVMYEMATGRRAFDSTSAAGVIAAVLQTDPPPPSSIEPAVPATLEWVIQKALAKNPEARWQAAGDIVEILRWMARAPGVAAAGASRRSDGWLPGSASSRRCSRLSALSARIVSSRPRPPPEPSLMFSIDPPATGGFTPTTSSVQSPQFALSPDGRRLVFVASIGHEPPQLWLRELHALNPEPVAGTQGAEYPFWSPDSASLGFFANGSLKRIDLAGGPARVLAPARARPRRRVEPQRHDRVRAEHADGPVPGERRRAAKPCR